MERFGRFASLPCGIASLSVISNESVTFGVAYEDEHVLVIEKRAGLVTQPGLGHEDDSLLNGLYCRWGNKLQNLGKLRDYGLLHRLDRETSGLLVVGLSGKAYDGIRQQFEKREVKKFYWAICNKAPRDSVGLVKKPLAEVEPKRQGEKKMAIIASPPRGKPSETAFRVLASNISAALLECRPLSGRLHQIRVHMEAIGCSILGDGLYARPQIAAAAPRLALHAHRLSFVHPITGEVVDARSDFPADLRPVLRRMKLPLPVA